MNSLPQYQYMVNFIIDAKSEEYPNRSFHLTKLLGFGSEGGAFLATASGWGNNPQEVAIKMQKNMKPNEKQFLINLLEYQTLYENGNNKIHYPSHIIRLYGYFQSQENHCLIMEAGKESLFDYINQNQYQNVSIQQREKICFQIILPIKFLHQQKLIHRDIKPENYIKVGDNFKLIDFGLIRTSFSENKTKSVGSLIFQAPEIVEMSSSYTEKVDIWSLACVFYEIITPEPLFDGQRIEEVLTSIKNHKTQPQIVNNKICQLQVSQKVKEIMIKMLTYAENDRPSILWVDQEFQNYFNGFKPSPPPLLTFPTSNDVLKNKQEFIKSTQNDYPNQLKEKDQQIETLMQSINQQEKLFLEANEKLKKEYETNLNEFKQICLKEIDSLKSEKLKNEILIDGKFKQVDEKLKEQWTKIVEQDKIYIKRQDLDKESQYIKKEIAQEQQKVIALEQQKVIDKQEDNYQAIKNEIQNQHTQMQNQFNYQLTEIKQNYQAQLNELIKSQQDLNEYQKNIEKENKNKMIEMQRVVEDNQKIKMNQFQEEIQGRQELLIDQKINQITSNLKEKQLIFEQFNKYTSMIIQDLKDLQLNNDTETNHNVNNNLSNQQQTQDQCIFNTEITNQQQQKNDSQSNIQECESQNNQANVSNLTSQTIQEYKNLFENFRTQLLKQVQDILLVQEIKLNQNNQVYIEEKKEVIEKYNKLESSNKELTNQQQDLQKSLNYIIAKEKEVSSQLEKVQTTNMQENQKQIQEISELNLKIKQLEEKDKQQNLDISTLKQEITNQNQNLQQFEQQDQQLQAPLNEANQPLSQVNALCKFFKNKENLKEFSEKYEKDFLDLVACINDSC